MKRKEVLLIEINYNKIQFKQSSVKIVKLLID
jgi:hypothetical protein